MDVGKTIIKQLKNHVSSRQLLESNWKEAFEYTMPLRGQSLLNASSTAASNAQNAKAQRAQIVDSTASTSVRLLASSIISGLTPGNSQWFTLQIPGTNSDSLSQESKHWLEQSSTQLFKMIHSSNYNGEALEFFQDVVIGGMCGLYIEKDPGGPFKFSLWPLESLYCDSILGDGRIDTVFRVFHYSAKEAENVFGFEALSDEIKNHIQNNPDSDKKFEFIHAIRPRLKKGKQIQGKTAKQMPWESIYVCKCSGKVVKESGYHEFPVIIPRWSVIPKSVYAVGPIDICLPDIKSLNLLVRNLLLASDMAITPPVVVKNDGILNANTLQLGPRKIIVAADTDNLKQLNTGMRYDIGSAEIDRMQSIIRAALMADELSPIEKKYASATEVRDRADVIRQILGPIYARLQSEFLYPLIARCYGLAYRDGSLGQAPEEIFNLSLTPEYQSPLARAQKMESVRAMDQFEQSLAVTAQVSPQVLDLYDFDKASRRKAELLGVPVDLLRSDAQVKASREEQAKALQAQAAQENQMKIAS